MSHDSKRVSGKITAEEILRLLLVEDSPTDAEFVRRVLAAVASPRFSVAHSECLDDALRRLNEERFDVVLLDLSLPDSDGVDTVRGLCTRGCDVPTIVMTGFDNETLGVEAVQAGAQDYLLKGKTDGPLIVRAIRYAIERHRTTAALRESEAKYRGLVEAGNVVVYTIDEHGVFAYVSPAVKAFFGYEPSELVGRRFDEFVQEEDVNRATEAVLETMAGGSFAPEWECRIVAKSGDVRWIGNYSQLIHAGDKVAGIHGVIVDITERKRAQETQRRQDEQVQSSK